MLVKSTVCALGLRPDEGMDVIPSNVFSIYDQVLDTICIVGPIPQGHSRLENPTDLELCFAMERGSQYGDLNLPATEMTKWFDTNYHDIVPEILRARFSVLHPLR
jgi:5-methyltetrahydropteroyltriglutamate--homocysteine methyltransferase